MSQFVFSDFIGKSRARKPNKSQTNWVNITYSIFVRINRWFQLHILSFIFSLFYFLAICSKFPFHIRLHHCHCTPPPWPVRALKKVLPHRPRPLTSPSLPPNLYNNHHASRDTSAVAPSGASNEELPSPWLCWFVATTTVNDCYQLQPILCRLCQFILNYPYHPPFIYVLSQHPTCSPSWNIPPPYTLSYKTKMIIWKENQRKIHRNLIRRPRLTSTQSLILI